MSKLHQKKYFYIFISVLITLLFLSPNLVNDFLNWDDTAYVLQNELIRDLSFKGIKEIFTTPEVVSTYAPLVLISWAVDYALAGLNPLMFHVTNLLLHLLVVSLVYCLASLLGKNKIVALITAVLFGIHPMHVEVVGWISARKDLLYTLFFLGALIVYYFYTEKETKYPKYYYYTACLVFFIFSLLSKGTAVILPLVLFLFDYLKGRKFNFKLIIEKLPFLLLSIFFVILSINMQAKGGAMEDRQFVDLVDALSVGFYGYSTYLIKVIIPFNLSAYHPYPNQLVESNPWFYYASAIPVLGLFTWLMTKLKKNRTLVFGFGFFFITLIPVIQVLPFGSAVTADRYTYLPYFGLLYLIGLGSVWLYNNYIQYKKIVIIGLPIYAIILGTLSYQYSKTFKNGETLWTNVIKHYPNDFLAYMNRAEYRISQKKYIKAIQDSDKAIVINPNYAPLYYNRAIAKNIIGENKNALNDLSTAIKKNNSYMVAYLNRGLLYGNEKHLDKAIQDFTKVIELAPNKYYGYYNRAVYLGNKKAYIAAISDLDIIINREQFLPESHYLRAKYYVALGNKNKGFKDFSRVMTLNPSMANAFTKRGHLWLDQRLFKEALKDYDQAIFLDPKQVDAYINRGIIYMNQKKYNKAAFNFETAKKIEPNNYLVYYNIGLLYQLGKKHKKAIAAFEETKRLNPEFILAKQAKTKSERFIERNNE